MWPINHFTIQTERTGIRIGGKQFDDAICPLDFCSGCVECRVNDRDLVRMYRKHSFETIAPCTCCIGCQTVGIAVIRINRVNGGHRCGGCSEQTK